jgi:hypothetical protein
LVIITEGRGVRRLPDEILTRRDFLKGMAYSAIAAKMAGGKAAPSDKRRAKVVLVRDKNALDDDHRPNPSVIADMLDKAVMKLVEEDDPVRAWRKLVKPTDLVGIKTNVWEPLPTPKEVEEYIKRRVLDAGVKKDRILIDDRGAREKLSNCSALINACTLRTHHWSGIGGCIKNYIMFVEEPWKLHLDSCADVGSVWNLPIVKGKTRINILVALRPLFHGRGPHHYDPRYVWDYKGIFVSFDPVAVDAMGLKLLEVKRRAHFGMEIPFPTLTKHVVVADLKHGIGVSDPKRIDLIKIGWMEDVLI